jgi:hypothetical protein
MVPAFRYLGLVDDQLHTTEDLHRLASSFGTPNYPEQLSGLLADRYSFLTEIDLSTCTPGMLAKAFDRFTLSADVSRKALRFFLNAARAAGKAIGPKLSFGRRVRLAHRSTFSRRRRVPAETILFRKEMLRKLPDFQANWPAGVQLAWLASFSKLAD